MSVTMKIAPAMVKDKDGQYQEVPMFGFLTDSGDSISFHKLHTEYVNGDWVIKNDAGVVQTFTNIDAAFKNPRKFVYMVHTNIVMIPAFSETQGFEFTGQYKLNGNVSNVRVIINSQNELHMDDDYLEQTYYKVDSMEDWDFDDPDSKPCYPTVEAVLNYISQHGGAGGVSDVTVNGTSVVQDGVANIPIFTMTQEEYDLLEVKNPSAIYLIVDGDTA